MSERNPNPSPEELNDLHQAALNEDIARALEAEQKVSDTKAHSERFPSTEELTSERFGRYAEESNEDIATSLDQERLGLTPMEKMKVERPKE